MPATIYNMDIAHVDALLRRFTYELLKSVSSGTSSFNEFDQARLASYLSEVDALHAWILSMPQIDAPESHPMPIILEDPPETPDVENESVNALMRMFSVAIIELRGSQSARHAAGLQAHDSVRLTAIVQRARNFLEQFIHPTEPSDIPESSPQSVVSGPGIGGT